MTESELNMLQTVVKRMNGYFHHLKLQLFNQYAYVCIELINYCGERESWRGNMIEIEKAINEMRKSRLQKIREESVGRW